MRYLLLFVCFLFLQSNTQDAWKKVKLKGNISVQLFTTSKEFDYDGEIIRKSESELHASTDQRLTFYIDRYGIMAKYPEKLYEFNETNIHHLFFGEVWEDNADKALLFPAEFSYNNKTWEKCNDEGGLILTGISEANGVSEVTAVKTHLSMIQTQSQEDVDLDKILTKALDAFGKQVMDMKRENDAKNGKPINEDDYFLPAGLYNPDTFGLYLFTNWWSTNYENLPMLVKNKSLNCDTKKWEEHSPAKTDLYISDDNRKLMEDYNEDGSMAYFRYIGIPAEQMENFIINPTVPTTFIGGSYQFFKDYSSEKEFKMIIKLTVSSD